MKCQVVDCGGGDAGPTTTVTGVVYDPAGKIPLYNAIVYVPQSRDVPAVVPGASCDRCGTLTVEPAASALTNIRGEFTLTNVPVGADIPVIVQIGKWRKQVTLNVEACKNNPLADKLTLPKNQQEGSMPHIAVSLGSLDPIVCLLSRIGIDDAEFTQPGEGGCRAALHRLRQLRVQAEAERLDVAEVERGAVGHHRSPQAVRTITVLACEGDEYNGDKDGSLIGGCGNKDGRAEGAHAATTSTPAVVCSRRTITTRGSRMAPTS